MLEGTEDSPTSLGRKRKEKFEVIHITPNKNFTNLVNLRRSPRLNNSQMSILE